MISSAAAIENSSSSSADPKCPNSSSNLPSHHLPPFSIRDYVLGARSKDIATNWPFSLNNLHLCLKHGLQLQDVLPPFQSAHAIRNYSHDHPPLPLPNPNPTSSIILTAANHNTSITIATNNNNSCASTSSELPTNNSTQSATAPRISHNNNNNKPHHNPKTKCKLILKFTSQSAEDIASNSTTTTIPHSESMASKVCPVCKTFSSTSNTTLNAHIDQCLSVESSTPKWTVADSNKLSSTRHRIKPRKTRLMVDIYATALPCTLEDLDRRNGSNWASSAGASNFPTPDPDDDQELSHDKSETPAVAPAPTPTPTPTPAPSPAPSPSRSRSRSPSPSVALTDDVGAVYIDSNGIKLRILSKSEDMIPQAVSKVRENLRPRKPFKGSKFLSTSTKKKRRGASKFSHYLKLAQTKKLLSSSKPPSSSQKQQQPVHGDDGKKDDGDKAGRCNWVNPGSCGTALRQWACSKRSGAAKKFNNKVCYKSNWNVSSQDLKIHTPCSDQKRVASSPENEGEAGGQMVDIPRPLLPMKHNTRQPRKETSSDYRILKPCNSTAVCTPPSRLNSDLARPSIGRKLPRSRRAFRSKVTSMPTSRPTPMADSSSDVAVNKSNVRPRSDDELELAPWDSQPADLDHNFATSRNHHQRLDSPCRSTRELNAGLLKETTFFEEDSLQYHPRGRGHGHGHDVGNDMNNSGACSMDVVNVSHLSSKVAVGERVSSSHKSVDSEMNRLVPHSLQYKEPLCDIPLSNGPSFGGAQEMIYGGVQLGNGILVQNVNMGEDLNPEVARGSSSFADVDPIPIPGPPGSFLPSPRDMGGGSEDFQGNSSLTTSRVQSSQDQHDIFDGYSSDSPVSATSTISNSTDSRYELKHPEALVRSAVTQDKIRSSFDSSESKERFEANNKKPLSFNNEPCCCQRKERATHNHDHVILNSQESQLLKRRALNFPGVERQMSCYLGPNTVGSDHMFSNSGKVVLPVPRAAPAPLTSQNLMRGPTVSGDGRGRNDCDSMSPSPSSNSVLRLMGKNLMVVNRDHQASMPAVQPQLPQSQIPMFQQQVHRRNFHRDSSVMFGHDSHDSVDARFSNGSMRSSQMIYHAFPNQHVPHPDYDYSSLAGSSNQKRSSRNRPMGPPIPAVKEVITIDGDEADLRREVAAFSGGFVSASPTPFNGAQSDNHHHHQPFLSEAALIRQASGISPVGWPSSSCNTDGSTDCVVQQSRFIATPSSSRGHLYKCQSSLL